MRNKARFFVIFIAASYPARPAVAIAVASDDASQQAYADGWQSADNGGTGFSPWTLAFSGKRSDLLYDPQFIDRGPLAGDSLGAPTFALTTGARNQQYDTSEVTRGFSSPLAVGQTFSLDVDGSALDPAATAFTTGNTIQLFGSDGTERFALFTSNQYNSNNWTSTGAVNTDIPAANAFHISLTLATTNTYNLVLAPVAGGSPLFSQTGAVLDGTAGSAIQSFRISAYGTGSSSNGSKELFFDNLSVMSSRITGDYNNNGRVDAADYVVWRKSLGTTGSGLPADGNGNNTVDAADYTVWRSHFGAASGPASAAVDVPEPSSEFLSIASATLVLFLAATPSCLRKTCS